MEQSPVESLASVQVGGSNSSFLSQLGSEKICGEIK